MALGTLLVLGPLPLPGVVLVSGGPCPGPWRGPCGPCPWRDPCRSPCPCPGPGPGPCRGRGVPCRGRGPDPGRRGRDDPCPCPCPCRDRMDARGGRAPDGPCTRPGATGT